MRRMLLAIAALSILSAPAHAETDAVLRTATIAPDGSSYAQEIKAFARDVERGTDGHVRVKVYFGGIAGDELEQIARIRRDQLDATIGGGMQCQKLAPSMAVARLPGVFQSRDEADEVLNRIEPALEKEAHEQGFMIAGTAPLGPDIIMTRTPIRSMEDLRRVRLWRWDLDEVGVATSREMGLQIVPLPVWEAARAYDEKRVDGFLAAPSAALIFQWSARARYVTDLRGSYLFGCVAISERSFDRLPPPYQAVVREASAKLRARFNETTRDTDEKLLGGLFQKQGVTRVPVSETFRAEFFAAARAARQKLAEKFVSSRVLERVLQLLADYRAEHQAGAR